MRTLKGFSFVLLLMVVVFSTRLEAVSSSQPQDYYSRDPITKLFRGVSNIIESPAEIGCYTQRDFYVGPSQATGDFLQGIFMGVRRALLGVIDVATFLFPGDSNLQPICEKNKHGMRPF